MKNYAIFDEALDRESAIGYLFYFEKSNSFVIELCSNLDEWEAPLLFQKFVKERRYTIPREVSLMWVQERIIPRDRQNIGSILKTHKLKAYSEIAMLNLSKGHCVQDDCYVREIKAQDVPKQIKDRMRQTLWECFPTRSNHLVCMFKDDLVKKVDLEMVARQYQEISYVLANEQLLNSVKIGPGGYSIIFNGSIELPYSALRDFPVDVPLTATDFYRFASRNIIDTSKACDVLECTRQNLAYLVKEEKLAPVIYGNKEKLYIKGEIETFAND